MSEPTLLWKGKEVNTIGELVSALGSLESREEGEAFAAAYAAISPHAAANIGYSAGYLDPESCQRVLDWCRTTHPIFGRTTPTPDEAFAAGQRMARGE